MIWLVLIILGLIILSCWEAWTRYQRKQARYRHPVSLKKRLP